MACRSTVALAQGKVDRFLLALAAIAMVAGLTGLWHAFLAPRLGRAMVVATLATSGVLQALAAAMVCAGVGYVGTVALFHRRLPLKRA